MRQVHHSLAGLSLGEGVDDQLAGDARDRRLARRIHVRHHDDVRPPKARVARADRGPSSGSDTTTSAPGPNPYQSTGRSAPARARRTPGSSTHATTVVQRSANAEKAASISDWSW